MIALFVFLGGGLGSLARYGISSGLTQFKPGQFPLATLIANILSCVIIALAVGLFADRIQSNEMRAFIIIGFCGGFSTFSTFSNETFVLLKSGNWTIAILNILLSLILCIGIIYFLTLKTK